MNEEENIEALREKAEEAEVKDLLHSLTKDHSLTEKIISNIFFIFFISIILIGPIGFVSTWVCEGLSYIGLRLRSSSIEFPLGEISDMAIDKNDRLVCYLGFHRRVQVYTTDGEFFNGWFGNTSARHAKITIDDKNYIHVKVDYSNELSEEYIFDFDGNIISKENAGDYIYNKYHYRFKKRENKDEKGNSYYYREKAFHTQLIKVTPQGEEIVIATEPFYLLPFRYPLPGFFFVLLTVIIMAYLKVSVKKLVKDKKETNPTDLLESTDR